MYSSGNKFKRTVRMIIDVLNVLVGIGVIVIAVMTFLNPEENMWMFPIIFLLGGAVNFLTGIKNFITDRKISGIIAEVVAVVLFIVMYVSYRAIGG